MNLRAAGLLLVALASPALVSAQDQLAPPVKAAAKVKCAFCGAERNKDETVCPFCGEKDTVPSTTKPANDSKDSDLPKIAPAPDLKDSTPAPTPSPAPQAKRDPDAVTPDEESSDAKARAYKDDNMAKGDYYFKTGYYLKASEAYRVAVLAEPVNPWKKLAFGHALFAIGNYSYSSYALRRAVSQLDAKTPFNPDVSSLFPSKKAFEKAIKDLKRYVTYSPRDPAGLSVLGYMLFVQGEDARAKEMFVYLQRLPKNENDPFASFFLKQIDARKGAPDVTPPKEPKPLPPPPKPEPAPQPQPSVSTPEGARQDEEGAKPKPAPARALADE